MANLSVETIIRNGLNPTFNAAAGGGDEFANTGKEFIHLKNGDGSPMTVTIVTQITVDAQAVGDRAVVVGAGEERIIGPFPSAEYNDSGGLVQLTYSAVTSLTVAVLKV